MKQFQVPQAEMKVRIAVRGGHEFDGSLFYPPAGPGGAPGHLSDRLNDGELFLPLSTPQGGKLLNKHCMLQVDLGAGHRDELPELDVAKYVAVRVTLVDGRQLEGRLVYAMPPDRERVLDFLNSGRRFVPLEHDEGITMVNCDAIVEVAGDE